MWKEDDVRRSFNQTVCSSARLHSRSQAFLLCFHDLQIFMTLACWVDCPQFFLVPGLGSSPVTSVSCPITRRSHGALVQQKNKATCYDPRSGKQYARPPGFMFRERTGFVDPPCSSAGSRRTTDGFKCEAQKELRFGVLLY